MSDALKPCPHCDGTDIRCFRHSHLQGEPCVMCRTCFASAISPAAWNARATDAAIATDLSSPVVRAAFIIAAPTLAAVLGIEETMR